MCKFVNILSFLWCSVWLLLNLMIGLGLCLFTPVVHLNDKLDAISIIIEEGLGTSLTIYYVVMPTVGALLLLAIVFSIISVCKKLKWRSVISASFLVLTIVLATICGMALALYYDDIAAGYERGFSNYTLGGNTEYPNAVLDSFTWFEDRFNCCGIFAPNSTDFSNDFEDKCFNWADDVPQGCSCNPEFEENCLTESQFSEVYGDVCEFKESSGIWANGCCDDIVVESEYFIGIIAFSLIFMFVCTGITTITVWKLNVLP